MPWWNQANWDLAAKNYGLEDLLFLANHFKDMLDETGFNKDNLKSEWKSFKRMVNQNYTSVKCPLSMWQRIFTYVHQNLRMYVALQKFVFVLQPQILPLRGDSVCSVIF